MNDILSDIISRSSLCTKNESNRSLRLLAALDLQIFIDNIQRIQLLTLVLMKSFDLDIKNTVLINLDTSIFQNKILADFLRIRLNCKQLIQNLLVILESKQLFQLICIFLVSISDQRRDIFCKRLVTVHQPSAECNAIGLIIEFFRINLIELMQLRVLQNFGMKSSNTVDRESVMNIHMSHVNQIIAVNNSKILSRIFCFNLLI